MRHNLVFSTFSLISTIAGVVVSISALAKDGPRAIPFPAIAGGWIPEKTNAITKSTVAIKVFDGSGGENFCSGVLVDNNMVMTAAHCVAKAASVQIFLGQSINAPDHTTWARYVSHPLGANSYAAKNRYDAALIGLDVTLPARFLGVQLAPPTSDIKKDTTLTVAGFGASSLGSFDTGILKATELVVVDGRYSDMEILLKQTNENAICPGDSGGPAFFFKNNQIYLLGVANAGLGDGSRCGDTVIYADVRSESLMSRLTEVTEILTKPGI